MSTSTKPASRTTACWTRRFVYDVSRRTFDSNVYRGHEGVRRFASLIREQWATLRIEPKEFRAAGNEVVVSVRLVGVAGRVESRRHHGRGRTSGVEVRGQTGYLYTLRGGKIVRLELFPSREKTLEAAGLSE
jgi:ketosteroid isomerase-like protein